METIVLILKPIKFPFFLNRIGYERIRDVKSINSERNNNVLMAFFNEFILFSYIIHRLILL